MTAVALPPQTGLKRLAAALGLVCTVLFLLAVENRYALDAVQAVETGARGFAERATRLAGDVPSRTADGVARLTQSLPFAAPVAAAPEDRMLEGEFGAADGAAAASVAFAGAEVRFGSGETYRTEPLRIAAGGERFEAGQTFARRLNARADAQIELRRIVPATPEAGVPPSSLCDGARPGVVALLHRNDQLDVMLFRAGAGLGPDAPTGGLCGVGTFQRR